MTLADRKTRQRGYVLILTLFVLAFLSLIATRFAARIEHLRTQVVDWEGYTRATVATASAKAEAIFSIATQPLTQGGFGESADKLMVPDARPYLSSGNALVSVQDLRATISLNFPDRSFLRSYLLANGVPFEQTDRLIDVLEDFVDADDLRRLNGAEKADYQALGLPPPPDDWLRSVTQLRQMPGWRDYPDLLDRIERDASTRRNTLYNPNFFSEQLLAALPGASPERLALFLERRAEGPFRDARHATALTGWPFDEENMIFYSGDEFRLRIWSPLSPRGIELTVLITPGGRLPWWVYDAQPLHPAPDQKLAESLAPLPTDEAITLRFPDRTTTGARETTSALQPIPLPDSARPHRPAADAAPRKSVAPGI